MKYKYGPELMDQTEFLLHAVELNQGESRLKLCAFQSQL